jgi:hypothetical protein
VKIISLTIIASPTNKEKINFRFSRQVKIDVLKRGVLRQGAGQISRAGLVPEKIMHRRYGLEVAVSVVPMVSGKKENGSKQVNGPFETQVKIENTVNEQYHQRWHDGEHIARAQINKKKRIR